jgi:hypothetical protein
MPVGETKPARLLTTELPLALVRTIHPIYDLLLHIADSIIDRFHMHQ